ncbi:SMI1/KNR4 family protein [Priestia aryabhattai]|uniref:SMI1/KNR4 family protein n=1 Tax=Priestia aryabhattai TaxID=412384 RepID=UPI002E1FE50C
MRPVYPINTEIIEKAEANLGVKLPQSFIDLMKQKNGGELNYPYFMVPTSKVEHHPYGDRQNIPCIEPIHFETDDISLLSSKEHLKDANLSKELVVLWNDYHHWLVLDYRHSKVNPSVLYIIESYLTDEIAWDFIEIASSFDDFLKKLFRLPPLDPKQLKTSYGQR